MGRNLEITQCMLVDFGTCPKWNNLCLHPYYCMYAPYHPIFFTCIMSYLFNMTGLQWFHVRLISAFSGTEDETTEIVPKATDHNDPAGTFRSHYPGEWIIANNICCALMVLSGTTLSGLHVLTHISFSMRYIHFTYSGTKEKEVE